MTYSIYFTDIAQGQSSQWVLHPDYMGSKPVLSATLTDAVNSASVLEFTIPRSHPALSRLIESISDQANVKYYVYRDGTIIFEGRAYKYTRDDITGLVTFVVESEFARMNDHVVPPYYFSGTPTEYLEMLLDGAIMMQVGTVTVTDPNNYIVRSNENPSILWDEIADKCIGSSLGGYIETDQSGTYISWLTTPSASGDQGITKQVNLIEMTDEADVSSGFSAVYVYGADTGVENKYGQKQYVTLDGYAVQSELPSGYLWSNHTIVSTALRDMYGNNCRILHCENVTTQSALISRAVAYLESQQLVKTISLSALDMADIGEDEDSFEVGQTVTITARDVTYNRMLTRISRDLLDPSNTTFEFGDVDNISSSTTGASGGSSDTVAVSPNFWHTEVTTSGSTHDITGFSTLPLEDVLSGVESRAAEIDGGAVWLNEIPTNHSGFEVRSNNLAARITSASMTTYENSLTMTGVSATLAGKNAGTTTASVQVDGYNGNVDVTGGLRAFSKTANTVLAAPNGSDGTAEFRSLVPRDILSQTANGDYFDKQISSSVSVANVSATATTGGTVITSFTLGKGLWIIAVGVSFAANATGMRKVVISTTQGAISAASGSPNAMTVGASPEGGTRLQCCGITIINTEGTELYVNAGQSSGSSLNATCRARAIRVARN